jgi:hypothetical protein
LRIWLDGLKKPVFKNRKQLTLHLIEATSNRGTHQILVCDETSVFNSSIDKPTFGLPKTDQELGVTGHI